MLGARRSRARQCSLPRAPVRSRIRRLRRHATRSRVPRPVRSGRSRQGRTLLRRPPSRARCGVSIHRTVTFPTGYRTSRPSLGLAVSRRPTRPFPRACRYDSSASADLRSRVARLRGAEAPSRPAAARVRAPGRSHVFGAGSGSGGVRARGAVGHGWRVGVALRRRFLGGIGRCCRNGWRRRRAWSRWCGRPSRNGRHGRAAGLGRCRRRGRQGADDVTVDLVVGRCSGKIGQCSLPSSSSPRGRAVLREYSASSLVGRRTMRSSALSRGFASSPRG